MRRLQEITFQLCKVIVEYCDIQLKIHNESYELRTEEHIKNLLTISSDRLNADLQNLITTVTDPNNNGYGARQSFLEFYLNVFSKLHPLIYTDTPLTGDKKQEVYNELSYLLETTQNLLQTYHKNSIDVIFGDRSIKMPGMSHTNSNNTGSSSSSSSYLFNYLTSVTESVAVFARPTRPWLNALNPNLTIMGGVVEKNIFLKCRLSATDAKRTQSKLLKAIEEEQAIQTENVYVRILESDCRELEKELAKRNNEITLLREDNKKLTIQNAKMQQQLNTHSVTPLLRVASTILATRPPLSHASPQDSSSSLPLAASPYTNHTRGFFSPSFSNNVDQSSSSSAQKIKCDESEALNTLPEETNAQGYDCF